MPNKSATPNSSSGSTSSVDGATLLHGTRLEEHITRMTTFEEKTRQLTEHICSKTDHMVSVASLEALKEHGIELAGVEDFTNATQSNLPDFSTLIKGRYVSTKRSLYAHALLLKTIPSEYQPQLLGEALKILKYFAATGASTSKASSAVSRSSSSGSQSTHFLRLMEIFLVEDEQRVLVIEEKFLLENTLQHRIWESAWTGYYKAPQVKQWAMQLANAVEMLNQAGVAHRFIRAENVVLSSRRDEHAVPRLGAFDFAYVYWDVENRSTIRIRRRGLPVAMPSHLLDHLPPECFANGYDGSMVDVWSVGVIICLLMTGNTPFHSPELPSDSNSPMDVPDYIEAWKRSEERRWLPEEIRSLLDDVFTEADSRINAWEMAKDFRLKCQDTREFTKKKQPQYYRIDLGKKINVDGPPSKFQAPKATAIVIPAATFSENSSTIFNMEGFQTIREGGEASLANYRILREQSFTGDLGANVIVNDYYLKAARISEEQPLTDPPVPNCLVKIVQLRRIPIAHRNMLLNESTKILRHFSAFEPLNARVHRVLDIFLVQDKHLYLFFESLEKHKSLYQLLHGLSKNYLFPPPSRAANSARMLTLTKLQVWMHDLAQTAVFLAHHGLAHRYIRPEYVFINEQDHSMSKLTHFDLACFAWNPDKSILIKRTRAIQDQMVHLWNHLPPESFEPMYDCLLVDVWSIGVLFAFCITGAMPFSSPLTMEQAAEQWAAFKQKHAQVFNPSLAVITSILDDIFVPAEQRIKAVDLVIRLSPPLSLGDLAQPTRKRSTDVAPPQRVKSGDNPTGGKHNRASSSKTNKNRSGSSQPKHSKTRAKK